MSGTRVAFVLQLLCQILLARDEVAANDFSAPRKVLPDGYYPFEEIGVAYKYFPDRMFWDEARMKCMYDNGQLAAIDTEKKALGALSVSPVDYPGAIHAGIRQMSPGAYWTTSDGSPISEENVPWWPGKPSGDASCTILNKRNGYVYNSDCSRQWPFVCEIPLGSDDAERSSDNPVDDNRWETSVPSTAPYNEETTTTESSSWSFWG